MLHGSCPGTAAFCVALALGTPLVAAQDVVPSSRAVLDRYCVTCHNARAKTAGLALDTLNLNAVGEQGSTWEKVVRKLRTGEMPPAGRPRPDRTTYDAVAGALEASLDAAALVAPNPGPRALRRLNRSEYVNAVRDLLALDIDGDALLPPDESAHGFDNMADALKVSPLLLEQYVAAARKISRLAVGISAQPVTTSTYRAPADLTQAYRLEGMPFGTRGGVSARHHFPLDGEYLLRVRLVRDEVEVIRGLGDSQDLELSLDGERVKLFSIGGKSYGMDRPPEVAADEHLYVRLPVKAGPHQVTATFLNKTAALVEDVMKPFLRDVVMIVGQDNDGGKAYVGNVAITGPVAPTAATDTPSRRRIFTCHPPRRADGRACAIRIISKVARRAFRRPIQPSDLAPLLEFYDAGAKDGGFEAGVEMALRRILASPQFVFRFEHQAPTRPGGIYQAGDVAIASRLSFFLWSSIPDDALLAAAERGALKNPTELARQVRRMLNNPKARALSTHFAGQWLYLRNLPQVAPNTRLFPDFDDNLRRAFRRETELLFDSIVREDRSTLDLLNADFTFVNERLARHYGIPGVAGDHFRRVSVGDPHRRGLLGHGSILTVTSYGTRTSPVTRGKWILENVLASPPPPPPPNVPDLKEPDTVGTVLTMRERMVAHRANPVCASCHSRMDPLGLTLEHFDAIGRWRTVDVGEGIDATSGAVRPVESGTTIDSSGALPDGTQFDAPAGLREALLLRPEEFVKTVTGKLLMYALGRGLEYYDYATIREISRKAAAGNYRFSSLVMGVVMSTPFQKSTGVVGP